MTVARGRVAALIGRRRCARELSSEPRSERARVYHVRRAVRVVRDGRVGRVRARDATAKDDDDDDDAARRRDDDGDARDECVGTGDGVVVVVVVVVAAAAAARARVGRVTRARG